MAYTPKTWQCGEPIMADDLNHMEQGIAQGGSGGALIVTVTSREATTEECSDGGTVTEYSHTWQQMHDAIAAGKQVYFRTTAIENAHSIEIYQAVLGCYSSDNQYDIVVPGNARMPIRHLDFNSSTSNKVVECSVL